MIGKGGELGKRWRKQNKNMYESQRTNKNRKKIGKGQDQVSCKTEKSK